MGAFRLKTIRLAPARWTRWTRLIRAWQSILATGNDPAQFGEKYNM
jgi:hypothetical protein